ncbi:MAG: ArdC-like ssDNA-binding domain-containing protein, partial [Chloroflexota bacterium]|nr:ArdC-like ssDNA-binding domain-containing protein [Chloroflexota bacterium]
MNSHVTITVPTCIMTPAPSKLEPPTPSRQERAAQMAATVDLACERLAQQLAAGHTEVYLHVLDFFARFHHYSANNCLLIRSQRPDASRVAGLKRWNALGYTVRKGERAIWVLAPVTKKIDEARTGEPREVVVAFQPAPVFDAAQLNEIQDKPLPSLFKPLPDDAEDLFQRVRERIEGERIIVAEHHLPGGVQGVSLGGTILLRPGLDSRNRLFTLLHEYAHEIAHHGEAQRAKPREVREFEAESVAFVVAATLGFDIPTSADYLLSHGATAEVLRSSLGTVQILARR